MIHVKLMQSGRPDTLKTDSSLQLQSLSYSPRCITCIIISYTFLGNETNEAEKGLCMCVCVFMHCIK